MTLRPNQQRMISARAPLGALLGTTCRTLCPAGAPVARRAFRDKHERRERLSVPMLVHHVTVSVDDEFLIRVRGDVHAPNLGRERELEQGHAFTAGQAAV